MKYYQVSKEEIDCLKQTDLLMKQALEHIGEVKREVEKDPFKSLVSSIIYQQLAYKAANSIWNKFIKKIGDLTPKNLKLLKEEDLKQCGISSNKIKYLKSITEYFENGYEKINWDLLSDEEIIEKLIKIKGIGRWTAEMFLIFCLERKDITTYNDLGLKKGMEKLYGIINISEEVFYKLMESYKPYRTAASFYLWEVASNKEININLNLNYEIEKIDNSIGYIHTQTGWIKVTSINHKITNIDYVEYPDLKQTKINETTKKALIELDEYFKGTRKAFTVDLEINGTDFQKKVWKELLKIPYGKTISYQELAINIGDIKSTRAVGMANNKNKIPIIIPCHRVVGKNGKLVGYAGGIDKKTILLKLEEENVRK